VRIEIIDFLPLFTASTDQSAFSVAPNTLLKKLLVIPANAGIQLL